MDQGSDDGDEQHEDDGQLVQLEGYRCRESAHEDPLEERLPHGAVIGGATEEAHEQDHGVRGGADHHEHREGGTPAVSAPPAQQEDGRTEQRQGEQQPQEAEDARRLGDGLDDGRDIGRVRSPDSAGPDHGASFSITSCPLSCPHAGDGQYLSRLGSSMDAERRDR